jgi:murein endopeptidase
MQMNQNNENSPDGCRAELDTFFINKKLKRKAKDNNNDINLN